MRARVGIQVEVWRREREGEATMKVTEGLFTFVAIGPDRRPRPIPEERDSCTSMRARVGSPR
jgi:acyl-CoA thioesterase YciA